MGLVRMDLYSNTIGDCIIQSYMRLNAYLILGKKLIFTNIKTNMDHLRL